MRDVELSLTWIVCAESEGHPPGRRHADSVALDVVEEVVVRRALGRIEFAEPLSEHEEVESVQMKRVALGAEDTGALHHQLHGGTVRQHHGLGPVHHIGVVEGPGGRRGVGRDEHAVGRAGVVGRLGGEKHVGGLAWRDGDGLDGEAPDVDGVDHGEWVAGDGEEELVIDDPEYVRLQFPCCNFSFDVSTNSM
jgi:hypothetical protein